MLGTSYGICLFFPCTATFLGMGVRVLEISEMGLLKKKMNNKKLLFKAQRLKIYTNKIYKGSHKQHQQLYPGYAHSN